MKFTYLIIDIGAFIIPFIFSFHPAIRFFREWKAIVASLALPLLLFLPWDILFTNWRVWGFNEKYTTGITIANLPLEEILFFICIPYACLFTYYCLTQFGTFKPKRVSVYYYYVFSVAFTAVGFLGRNNLYTLTTFLFLGIFLLICTRYFKGNLFTFFKVYLVLLIPFFIVNGLLTGTGLNEPVVWYDNKENLNFRLLTIPVEDIFYGCLLILMNVFYFERLRRRRHGGSVSR